MLKQLILKNWKSFRHAVLDIDSLTILIGTNASGKSNVLEALEFLHRMAWGQEILTSLAGTPTIPSIRGGVEWSTLKSETKFTLEALVQGEDDSTDYLYRITVETQPRVQLFAESLVRLRNKSNTNKESEKTCLLYTDKPCDNSISVHFYKEDESTITADRFYPILSLFLFGFPLGEEVVKGGKTVLKTLQEIFILEPITSRMREYSQLSDNLKNDASNIAGLLAALPNERKAKLEETILTYMRHLPERDIHRVWAEPVGRLKSDAMLYCEEQWIPDQPPILIDARGMSDGTLRFLAIIVALLTRPEGSQLIIEDVDNGLHPSRAELLVRMLREIGEKRKIDILVTTHNPALLDALGSEIVPFVVVAHRDTQTGESKLTLLEDIENLPKLMALGSLGKLTTKGAIERSLSGNLNGLL